jgi:hypothetical protein
MLLRLSLPGIVTVLLVTSIARPSMADPAACIAASERGQSLSIEHHPVAARAEFLQCSPETCPPPIAKDCAERLARNDASIASVVPVAQGLGLGELRRVRVLMDGKLLAESIDGRAVPVDPGPHRFRFELAGGASVESEVIVEEGVRAKPVLATFPSAPPALAATLPPGSSEMHARAGVSPWAYVLGGLGIVGIGVGSAFGIDTIAEHDQLHSQSDLTAFHTHQALSDVGFGVGLIALGAATWIALAHRSTPTSDAKPEHAQLFRTLFRPQLTW